MMLASWDHLLVLRFSITVTLEDPIWTYASVQPVALCLCACRTLLLSPVSCVKPPLTDGKCKIPLIF